MCSSTKQKIELPNMLPCNSCGGKELYFESNRPEGRVADLWRVICSCGCASKQWSVSQGAAVRAWNRYMSQGHE